MIMVGHSKRLREPLSRGQRWALYGTIGVLLAAVTALATYGAVSSAPNDATSGHGCVSVTVASTTGGETLRYCGRAAAQWCRMESQRNGPVASVAGPQCRLAGFPFAARHQRA